MHYFNERYIWILIFLIHNVVGCPHTCICKWKNGKEWVECVARGLQGLPQGAREETQVLDLSNNQINVLPVGGFFALRLVNLQRVYLKNSGIQNISDGAFTGLQGLIELDISENFLNQIPSEAFASIRNLMRLNLAGNAIHTLKANSFHYLDQLTFLDLSRCGIKNLESGTFTGLHSLEWLRLNDNLLEYTPESSLPLTANLHGISLHGNPWLCDCRLSVLYNWLESTKSQAPQESDPICADPNRLKHKPIRTLKIQDLACIPNVTISANVDVYENDNTTMQCEIFAIPRSLHVWLFNGQLLQINQDSSAIDKFRNKYIYTEEIQNNKIISNLTVLNTEQSDQGNYVCQAENIAGTSWSNFSLHILIRQSNVVESSNENSEAGFAAAIAAGALLGTLFALGCLFLGIFLYARRLRSSSINNLKQKTLVNDKLDSLILKRQSKNLASEQINKSNKNSFSHFKTVGLDTEENDTQNTSNSLGSSAKIGKPNEVTHLTCLQNQLVLQRSFIEPDLINEVPTNSNLSMINYRQFCEPCIESFSNCLDHDGYPLNFGLPKLGPKMQIRNSEYEIPPSVRRHPQFSFESSNILSELKFPQKIKILDKDHFYSMQQCYDKEHYTVASVPFIPSPPPAYRSETTTLLSHPMIPIQKEHSSIQISKRLETDGSNLYADAQVSTKRIQNSENFDNSESPDEGYVGDAMDI